MNMEANRLLEVNDNSRIELHPLYIHEAGEDTFRVVRWGGRSRIATRRLGIDAIEMFRRGASIGEVQEELSQRHNRRPSEIVLAPLLTSLYKANLIRGIDSHDVGSGRRQVTLHTLAQFIARFYLVRAARAVAARVPSVKIRRRLIFWINRWDLKRAFQPKLESAAKNLGLAMPDKSAEILGRICGKYFRHLMWNIVDVQTLMMLPPKQIDRFLAESVTFKGRQYLDAELAKKNGVILCGFHCTSNSIMPAFLMKHGYSLISMGTTTMDWGIQKTRNKVCELQRQVRGYGSLHIVESFSLDNINVVIDWLKRGGILICLPDVYSVSVTDEETKTRATFFGLVRTSFPASVVKIRLLGVNVNMNEWAGWLAMQTGASVLPAFVLRHAPDKLEFRIEKPVAVPQKPDRDNDNSRRREHINQEVFRTLDRFVEQYPEQWFGWHNLHKLGLEAISGKPTG